MIPFIGFSIFLTQNFVLFDLKYVLEFKKIKKMKKKSFLQMIIIIIRVEAGPITNYSRN
jgi:hypothetical protein